VRQTAANEPGDRASPERSRRWGRPSGSAPALPPRPTRWQLRRVNVAVQAPHQGLVVRPAAPGPVRDRTAGRPGRAAASHVPAAHAALALAAVRMLMAADVPVTAASGAARDLTRRTHVAAGVTIAGSAASET